MSRVTYVHNNNTDDSLKGTSYRVSPNSRLKRNKGSETAKKCLLRFISQISRRGFNAKTNRIGSKKLKAKKQAKN
jgi:hypothetical protein